MGLWRVSALRWLAWLGVSSSGFWPNSDDILRGGVKVARRALNPEMIVRFNSPLPGDFPLY